MKNCTSNLFSIFLFHKESKRILTHICVHRSTVECSGLSKLGRPGEPWGSFSWLHPATNSNAHWFGCLLPIQPISWRFGRAASKVDQSVLLRNSLANRVCTLIEEEERVMIFRKHWREKIALPSSPTYKQSSFQPTYHRRPLEHLHLSIIHSSLFQPEAFLQYHQSTIVNCFRL